MVCSGADMKLDKRARALLTLGPQMGRDKLMQAALRMRQLAKQQRLLALANAEVSRDIWKTCNLPLDSNIEAKHVIQWVHHNLVGHILKVSPPHVHGSLRFSCP